MADELDIFEPVEPVENNPRDLNTIMGLELTELTPEELEIVVEEKARVKARDQQHIERLEAIKQAGLALAESERESNRRFETMAATLTEIAIKRYQEASKDNGEA